MLLPITVLNNKRLEFVDGGYVVANASRFTRKAAIFKSINSFIAF